MPDRDESTTQPVTNEHAVEAHDLTLAHGTHVAVRESTCHIPTGRVTAIIGPNGSGKSTLLQAITGLLEPVSGRLRVLGGSAVSKRPRVSYVMQNVEAPVDLPLTVQQTVAMGRYASRGWFGLLRAVDRAAIATAMERMRIADLADRRLYALSGGQRHRVLVAQGLAQDHDILILDEPLAGLDVVSAEVIDGIVHDTADGCAEGHARTVIHTTHDLAEAQAADHVILMGGRVVAEGPPNQVLTEDLLGAAFGTRGLHPPRD